jgi:transcriptional regulator with XRE-family HTH domain
MKPDISQHNPDPAYLRGLRKQACKSQQELAQMLGLSRRVIQYYEAEEGEDSHRPAPYLYQYALERLAA